jgi:hypothetical protein
VVDESKGGQCGTGSDGCIIGLSLAFPESFQLKQLRQNYSPVSLNNSCLTQMYCFSYRREVEHLTSVLLIDCFYDEVLELLPLTAAAS